MPDDTTQTTSEQAQVEEKITQPQAEAPAQEQEPEDKNWRAFREARKQDRLAKEAAERKAAEKAAEAEALRQAMESILSRQQNQPQQTAYGYQEETEEQLMEKKIAAMIQQREEAAARARMEQEQREYPERLRRQYPDFEQVMNSDNLDFLEYHYPEVARPLGRLQDGYDKWSDIYNAVKKLVPNAKEAKRDAQRAEANAMKPRSASTTGATQSQDQGPMHLTEERKRANWERMQKTLKGLS